MRMTDGPSRERRPAAAPWPTRHDRSEPTEPSDQSHRDDDGQKDRQHRGDEQELSPGPTAVALPSLSLPSDGRFHFMPYTRSTGMPSRGR